MRVSDAVLNSHMREYVSSVMSESLRRHGFTSKNKNQAHWYRIKGGELVQAIFFSTGDGHIPAFADIYYCCHPLFVMPDYPKGTRKRGVRRSIHAVTPYKVLAKQGVTTAPYSSTAMVMCPMDSFHGVDIAEEVIALLNGISTIEQCYQKHQSDLELTSKRSHIPIEELWLSLLSPEMMDEIVFLDDKKMYSYCAESLRQRLDRYEMWESRRKLSDVETYEFNEMKRLKFAIIDGQRSAHLEYLAECSRNYTLQLEKKVKGIQRVL